MNEEDCDHLWKLQTEIFANGKWGLSCAECGQTFKTLEDFHDLFGGRAWKS